MTNAPARVLLVLIAPVLGCDFRETSIGDEIEALEGSSTGSVSATDSATGNLGTTGDAPEIIHVGAALGSEGLCPFQFDEAYALTLQFTPGSQVCNASLWDALVDEGPTWYVWIGVSVTEPGIYALADVDAYFEDGLIEAGGGGGGAAGEITAGTLEITAIDATHVVGSLSGVIVFGLNDARLDINGPFDAVRCNATEWLDVEFDPANEPPEGFDPACTIPGA